VARWFKRAYPSGSFVCRGGLTSPARLRFRFPLVATRSTGYPRARFSRIRLPEKALTLWRTRLGTAWCPDASVMLLPPLTPHEPKLKNQKSKIPTPPVPPAPTGS
jgi:hypothetical protein